MQYSIGSKINCGRFANVYTVKKDGKTYAAKVLPKHRIDIPDARNFAMINREINNHKKVNGHPNIIRLVEVVEDWGNFYLIEECSDKGDLAQYIDENVPSDETIRRVLKDCLAGITRCHEAGFIFGDLKPSNILLFDSGFKLCDFGGTDAAKDMYTGSKNVRGTPVFLAPETFVYKKEHGFIADMWSLGMLAYVMFFYRYPYDVDCTQGQLIEQIDSVDICYSGKIPAEAEDFIRRCLVKDARGRMTPAEALSHPFLRGA